MPGYRYIETFELFSPAEGQFSMACTGWMRRCGDDGPERGRARYPTRPSLPPTLPPSPGQAGRPFSATSKAAAHTNPASKAPIRTVSKAQFAHDSKQEQSATTHDVRRLWQRPPTGRARGSTRLPAVT